ncbi:MAG: sugar ABC transporter ATP-binding protein [Planctomycetota bacterium]
MSNAAAPRLETHGLTKQYGHVTVLHECNLSLQPGSIHALLGANGAGKSTFVRMVAGLIMPSSGTMTLGGQAYSPAGKADAEQAGVEIVQQELNLIPTLSVAENLQLAKLPARFGVIRRDQLKATATRALERVGLGALSPDERLGNLGVGTQQMVEIAAALDRKCRVLILDEPTAALTHKESENLFRWLESLRQEGVAMVYISHRLDEVKRLADQVSILRDGQLVGTYDAADLNTDQMVDLMSGETNETAAHPVARNSDNSVRLRVAGLSGGPVEEASFEVRRGECFGIAGLVGSGRTELLRLIFGADAATSGHLEIGDRSDSNSASRLIKLQPFRHPSDAVAKGIAMVTEDRKVNGLLLSQSIRTNATLASLWKRFSSRGLTRVSDEANEVASQCESMAVRCNDIEQRVGSLSGGNQQKVAIAKWLVRDAEVFLFDEPTRGIDVAARRRIYQLLQSLAAKGKGIVVVSSDTDELFEICDRIAVMSNGRLGPAQPTEDWTSEKITQASFSGYIEEGAMQ